MNSRERDFVAVAARRIVPEFARLSPAELERFWSIFDAALMGRSLSVRFQFRLFLVALRWLPLLRYGRPLDGLNEKTQDEALRLFESAPLSLVRKGFWGLKTMVFMGYYGRPEAGAAAGWTPSHDGNARLARR